MTKLSPFHSQPGSQTDKAEHNKDKAKAMEPQPWAHNTGHSSSACAPSFQLCRFRGAFDTALLLLVFVFLCWSCPLVHSLAIESSEVGVLTQLEQAWGQTFNGWTVAGECSSAQGIICNSEGFVVFLNLTSMGLSGSIPPALGQLSHLKYLNLNYNLLTGDIPTTLSSLVDLRYMGLYSNQLTGELPTWIGNLPSLQYIFLSYNQFTGTIPTGVKSLLQLVYIGLQWNRLTGELPSWLGNLPNLTGINVDSNFFRGNIPTTLSNLSLLAALTAKNNSLQGEIPTGLGAIVPLQILDLGTNHLVGKIPSEIGSLLNLRRLNLNNNNITGSIPTTLSRLVNLTKLSFASNKLSGNVPTWLGLLRQLKYLDMSVNKLSGTIPDSLSSLTQLSSLSLNYNFLSGSIPTALGNLKLLQELFMWRNLLTGTVPSELGMLPNLRSLWISYNSLTGRFPTTFINLVSLVSMKADRSIACPIPTNSCLSTPPVGSWGSFCYSMCPTFCNACYGGTLPAPVPDNPGPGSSNSTTNATDAAGGSGNSTNNPGGAGADNGADNSTGNQTSDGNAGSSGDSSTTSSSSEGGGSSSSISTGAVIGIVVAVVVVVVLLVLALVGFLYWRKHSRVNHINGKHVLDVEEGLKANHGKDGNGAGLQAGGALQQDTAGWQAQLFRPMTLAELRKATQNFSASSLVGKGGFGEVYLGTSPAGQKWAVKRSVKSGSRVDDAFKQEVLKLSRLSHPHLVSLLGYCVEKKERIVVYEFVDNGSLRVAIHEPQRRPLSFEQRVMIACGMARGLQYLHEQNPPIVHRDIKPDNILLDAQLEAKLADFGLLRAVEGEETFTQGAGTPGYIDPEYRSSLRLTTASDVFSFGMVLLEMFTGRDLMVDRHQDLKHAARLQLVSSATPVGIGSITLSCDSTTRTSGTSGPDSLAPSSTNQSSTGCIPSSSDDSSSTAAERSSGFQESSLPLVNDDSNDGTGGGGPFEGAEQHGAMPLRAWVMSVREKYNGRPTWLFVVLDPKLQPEYLPVEVMEQVLQIGIDCSAWEPSDRPDVGKVENLLSMLSSKI